MPVPSRAPSREDVERIAKTIADRAGLSLTDVVGASKGRRASSARQEAFRAILDETSCSIFGLAQIWGCDRKSIQRANRPGVEA